MTAKNTADPRLPRNHSSPQSADDRRNHQRSVEPPNNRKLPPWYTEMYNRKFYNASLLARAGQIRCARAAIPLAAAEASMTVRSDVAGAGVATVNALRAV